MDWPQADSRSDSRSESRSESNSESNSGDTDGEPVAEIGTSRAELSADEGAVGVEAGSLPQAVLGAAALRYRIASPLFPTRPTDDKQGDERSTFRQCT